ncbi:hypothetical protein CANDROIZ_270005 [Candidatus Roizmanbacteria bacterium]|nr:hypothetical protein CANDROIZ_270005 [Candidatus Roizmanbacteria bacterium]
MAYTQVLGTCALNGVEVQLLSAAQTRGFLRKIKLIMKN